MLHERSAAETTRPVGLEIAGQRFAQALLPWPEPPRPACDLTGYRLVASVPSSMAGQVGQL